MILNLKNPHLLKNIQNAAQILPLFIFPFQTCLLHDVQLNDNLITLVGTELLYRNTIPYLSPPKA